MDKACAELKPAAYKWTIGNKNSAGKWQSKFFTVPEYSTYMLKNYCLIIQPEINVLGLGKLCLCQYFAAPKKYDLRIALDYISGCKVISAKFEKFIKYPSKDCLLYILEIIETDGLKEITITFLRKRTLRDEIQSIERCSSMLLNTNPSSSLIGKQKPLKKYRRPPNAFMIFCNEKRALASSAKNKKCYSGYTLGKMWRDLPDSKKAKYFSEARRLRNLHKRLKTRKNGTADNKENSAKRKLEGEKLKQNKRRRTALDVMSGSLKEDFLSGEGTDVVIKVGDQEYKAHKIVLRYWSPVFYSMLTQDMIEENKGVITVSDCDQNSFRDFLLYLYTSKLDSISKGNMLDLYYMSHKYFIEELKQNCVAFIQHNLDIDVISEVITLATQHVDCEMLKYATEFFVQNAKDIVLTVKWQKFQKDHPIEANQLLIKAVAGSLDPALVDLRKTERI